MKNKMYYDYNSLEELKVGIGWYDITDKIKDPMMLGFSRNISEYWLEEMTNYKLKVSCFNDIDKIISWADTEDLNYIIVVSIGNNLSKEYSFLNEILKLLKSNLDFVLIGHILDKKEKYYELHHQCFILNMKWWRENNKPLIGNENNLEWETLEPLRSLENWHDDYTPYWIDLGNTIKKYNGKRLGWNLIDCVLKSNNKIESFKEDIRNSKFYLYPEVEDGYYDKISNVFSIMQSYTHFVANTENPPDFVPIDNINAVMCTASGITPLLASYFSRLKPHDKLVIYDFSPLAISVQQKLRNINFDYTNFSKSFHTAIKDFDISNMLRATDNIEKMQVIIDNLMVSGLKNFIDEVWPTLDVKYYVVDIFNIYSMKYVFDRLKNNRALIHLTNIFHYMNTSWMYNVSNRLMLEKDMLKLLSSYGTDKFYLWMNRPGDKSYRYHTPEYILANQDHYLSKNEELKVFPWIK